MTKQFVFMEASQHLSSTAFRIFNFLIRCAEQGNPTLYGDVANVVGLSPRNLSEHLDAINHFTFPRYEFLLSAIVHESGKGQPAVEFADYAWKSFGVRINSQLWYAQEFTKIEYWLRTEFH